MSNFQSKEIASLMILLVLATSIYFSLLSLIRFLSCTKAVKLHPVIVHAVALLAVEIRPADASRQRTPVERVDPNRGLELRFARSSEKPNANVAELVDRFLRYDLLRGYPKAGILDRVQMECTTLRILFEHLIEVIHGVSGNGNHPIVVGHDRPMIVTSAPMRSNAGVFAVSRRRDW